jgi:sigma-B regulation protein RsbU (phosphoserine phosphatase)
MVVDTYKSRQTLTDELRTLRQETARVKRRLVKKARQHQLLRRQLDEHYREVEAECAEKNKTVEALQLAELIIDNSPAILFRRLAAEDPKLRKMVYVSPNISRFGYTAEDFINGRIMFRDIVYREDSERTLNEIQTYVSRSIEEYTQIYRIITRQGDVRWIEDRTSVVEDAETGVRYHQGIVIDIHRRKEAEEKVRKSEEKYRRIVETAGEGFLLMDETLKIVDLNNAYCRMVDYSRNELIGKSLLDMVTEDYRQFFSAKREDLLNQGYYEFEGEIIARAGRSVPVLIHANALRDDTSVIIGNMAFITDMTEHKKALTLAGEVQKSLLPQQAPQVQDLDVSGKNASCDEIGGDYFDFLWSADDPGGPLTVVVGDITGHGVDSALLMTTARAFLRMRASRPGTITDIVTAMNQHLTKDVYESGRFMTLFYLTINEDRSRIEWVRAGHEPAWIYDPEQDSFEELKGPGLALGIDQKYVYRSNRKTGLKKGQVIMVGTDGIWEGRNKAGEMFGKRRLQEIIRRNAASSAETILTAVFRDQARFSQGTRTEDDITLVIIKFTQ